MSNKVKVVDIKCKAHFQNSIGSVGMPKITMYIDELIDDKFILTDSGSWYHHGGKQLKSISDCIEISGSRFMYEGEVHPCSGYEPTIDFDNDEVSFSLLVDITNSKTKDSVCVYLRFITPIANNIEIAKYQKYLDEYNLKLSENERKADEFFNLFK